MRILYKPNEYSQQRQREKKAHIYPVLLAMQAQKYRQEGHDVYWEWGPGKFDKIITEPENIPFLSLPHPDRTWTEWWKYQDNGNFKFYPGTYIQAANGCWHARCSFCVEKNRPYEIREVDDVISELWEIKKQGFKEVFDDSGTFPTGSWCEKFISLFSIRCRGIRFGCNTRIDGWYPFSDMFNAGFRMLLFGIESGSQRTLDKIQKGVKVEDIVPTIRKASECGLEPHIAVMFGYPWETDEDAIRTLKLVHYLLRKGYARTAQASYFRQGNLEPNRRHRKYIRQIYHVAFYPDFWFNQIKTIKDVADVKYIWKGIKSAIGNHLHKTI